VILFYLKVEHPWFFINPWVKNVIIVGFRPLHKKQTLPMKKSKAGHEVFIYP